MKFSEIPQLTKGGSYCVNVPLLSIERTIEAFRQDYGLNMDPDFQRAHVWTPEKRTKFVEYVLRGGKSSLTIYFNCPGFTSIGKAFRPEMVLVDGKQRLEAIRQFLSNELPVFGHYFKEFEDKLNMLTGIVFQVNDLPTRAEVLQWYIDLNDGGVIHTSEEIEKVRRLLETEKSLGIKGNT